MTSIGQDRLRQDAGWKGRRLAVMIASLVASQVLTSAVYAYSPVGRWQVSTGESRYEVLKCHRENICARLIWLRDDAQSPEALEYLNKFIVDGAIEVKPNVWQGALHYNGDTYQGQLLVRDEANMSLKGCKGILCQSFKLIKVNASGR